jgi:outer membrane protein
LAEAVALAYRYHPSILAQRAGLRGLDEGHAQAVAGYAPTLNASAQAEADKARIEQQNFLGAKTVGHNQATTYSGSLSAVQPLYTGGRVRAAINAADADILAGRQSLRQTESQLLQNVINAYVGVRASQDLLRLAERNVEILRGELAEIQARFDVRQVTRTDLAQAQARLAGVESQAIQARGRLAIARARYENLIGQAPGQLEAEPVLPAPPEGLERALAVAEANNPTLLAARYAERAAEARVEEAKAANRASVSLRVDLSVAPVQPYESRFYETNTRAAAVFSKPLFTGGLNASRIRQAQAESSRRAYSVEDTRLAVVESVVQAWTQVETVITARVSQARQLQAERLAFAGVDRERQFGLRTVIDVLNAEQERQAAEAALVQSRADEYAARAALLAAVGLLEPQFITQSAAP